MERYWNMMPDGFKSTILNLMQTSDYKQHGSGLLICHAHGLHTVQVLCVDARVPRHCHAPCARHLQDACSIKT